jgi:hypothetical protein
VGGEWFLAIGFDNMRLWFIVYEIGIKNYERDKR